METEEDPLLDILPKFQFQAVLGDIDLNTGTPLHLPRAFATENPAEMVLSWDHDADVAFVSPGPPAGHPHFPQGVNVPDPVLLMAIGQPSSLVRLDGEPAKPRLLFGIAVGVEPPFTIVVRPGEGERTARLIAVPPAAPIIGEIPFTPIPEETE